MRAGGLVRVRASQRLLHPGAGNQRLDARDDHEVGRPPGRDAGADLLAEGVDVLELLRAC